MPCFLDLFHYTPNPSPGALSPLHSSKLGSSASPMSPPPPTTPHRNPGVTTHNNTPSSLHLEAGPLPVLTATPERWRGLSIHSADLQGNRD